MIKICTSYIGYDFTFDNGKNVFDQIGLGRTKKVPERFRNSDDDDDDDVDYVYEQKDSMAYDFMDDEDYQLIDLDESDNDYDPDFYLGVDEYKTDDTENDSIISSISEDSDISKDLRKKPIRKKKKNKKNKQKDLRLIKKKSIAKLEMQYFITGNDMEFVYDIIWYPGIDSIIILFQFDTNSILILY